MLASIIASIVLAPTAYADSIPTLGDLPETQREAAVLMLIQDYGKQDGLSPKKINQVLQTIKCESHLVPDAEGDYGTSFGLAQIHLPDHPDITKRQAMDPEFATKWMVHQFSLGNESLWSCWNKKYGR